MWCAVEGIASSVVYVYGSSARREPVMQRNDRARSLGRSLKTLQTSVQRAGPAAAASYSLIGAILLFGGIGYGVRPLVRHRHPGAWWAG